MSNGAAIIGLKVATLGTGDGYYRLATGVPSWDANGIYRSVLASFPAEIGVRVDYQSGDVVTSGQDFELLRTAEVAGWFLRPNWRRSTVLSSAIATAAATTVVLDADLADGTVITLGRECIVLGTGTTTTTTSYAGCTRGALGTVAVPHDVWPTDDTEVFLAGASPVMDLAVELFTVADDATDYADEVTIWRGVLRPARWGGGDGLVKLTADSAIDVLKRAEICTDLWRAHHYAGSTTYQERQPTARTPDADPDTTGDNTLYPCILFDGKRAVATNVVLWDGETSCKWFTHNLPGITSFQAFGGGTLPGLDEQAGLAFEPEVHQLFAAAEGGPPVNAVGQYLSRNAIYLALQLLTTTPEGGNGAYDLGVKNLSGGVPATLIDVTGMEALAVELAAVVRLDSLFFPLDGKPVGVWELVSKRILRPFGLLLAPGPGGLLRVTRLQSGLATADVIAVGQADTTDNVWTFETRAVLGLDTLTVTHSETPGEGPETDNVQDGLNRSRSLTMALATTDLDAGGVRGRSRAMEINLDWTTRYHSPIPSFEGDVKRTLDLWPGDAVSFTHAVLPGRDGARGVDAEGCVVVARQDGLATGTTRITLWWVDAGINRAGLISPAARVVSFADPTLTIATNAFRITASDSTTWAALVALAGTVSVLILDSDLSVRGTASVTGTGTDTLTLSGATIAPYAGDVIVLAAYDTVGVEERDRYAHLADTNDTVGAAADDAYEWV